MHVESVRYLLEMTLQKYDNLSKPDLSRTNTNDIKIDKKYHYSNKLEIGSRKIKIKRSY